MLLLPLDTLPGWPHADNPSVVAILLLLVGLPVAVAAVCTVIGMGGRWRKGGNEDAYAPDVRRSMALAGAASPWSDADAGAENDERPPLTEGYAAPELGEEADGAPARPDRLSGAGATAVTAGPRHAAG